MIENNETQTEKVPPEQEKETPMSWKKKKENFKKWIIRYI